MSQLRNQHRCVTTTARSANQPTLQEIRPGCASEGLMLKHQYSSPLMRRADSLEKTLMLGNQGGRRRGRQRMRWLEASLTQWTWVWASSGRWWWTGRPGLLQSMGLQSQTWLSDWTELNCTHYSYFTSFPLMSFSCSRKLSLAMPDSLRSQG